MNKKKIVNIAISTILLLIVGYISYTTYSKNITQDKASKVAINHMKEKENIDLVVTKVDILHGVRDGFIDVEGYSKNDKKKVIRVTINKTQNYLVSGWGFKDQR
ncbi:TPA: hypothetical protein ACGW5B_005641 [Bacillus paranthracis]|uniref:Uncharacterized protein n=2 Tax=Bacillus cereus group TaxID=86661 RepID=A0A2C9YS55_BACTU|nr:MULTISPECIES: hypothetical protein [Bacillus]EEM91027.1 hypothetical protein bthur0012_8330 [Bacillus thuringiensis serovar pulsiensis BGSC 4CC1]MCX9099849.1 hypothetical protein [Bacillus anthracis]MDD8000023.1 hypothetical protein [Bacillus cereus]MDQ4484955.1 hypothetical protein [Bacillus cereus]OTY77094.1 hypothetical protein BK749_10340 [Bacillus thuringiensis serovar vazensis]